MSFRIYTAATEILPTFGYKPKKKYGSKVYRANVFPDSSITPDRYHDPSMIVCIIINHIFMLFVLKLEIKERFLIAS